MDFHQTFVSLTSYELCTVGCNMEQTVMGLRVTGVCKSHCHTPGDMMDFIFMDCIVMKCMIL